MLDPTRMDDVLRRGGDVATLVGSWKSLDAQRRKLQGELNALQQQRNEASDTIKKLDKKSPEFVSAVAEMKALGARIKEGETLLTQLESDADGLRATIPNAPHASVPAGAGEA